MKKCIAIIDDGINLNECYCTNIISRLQYNAANNRIEKRKEYPAENVSHATVVVAVLSTFVKNVDIIDIRIMNDGVGTINGLVKALEWCFEYNVDVINLSLGTINYYDYYLLYPIVHRIVKKGIFIIAAYHNSGAISFPAYMEGVIGVCRNQGLDFNNGEFTYKEINNKIVITVQGIESIDIGKETSIATAVSNSYVTPIITAYVYKMINQCYISFDELKNHLRMMSKGKGISKLVNCTCKKDSIENIPVIELKGPMKSVLEVKNVFERNSYNITVIGKDIYDNTILPIDMYSYFEDGKIKLFMGSIEETYAPSCVLIYNSRGIDNLEIEDINMYVCWEQGFWILENKDKLNSEQLYYFLVSVY